MDCKNIETYHMPFCFIPVLQKGYRNIHELYNYRHLLYLPDVTKEIFICQIQTGTTLVIR